MRPRILIVCNNPANFFAYEMILEKAGASVTGAFNAYDALQLFTTAIKNAIPFDAAIVEYLLQGLDGIALAEKMHKLDPRISLMLLPTPFLLDEDVKRRYAEFGGFTQKPDSSSEGLKRLLATAKQRKQCRENENPGNTNG